MEEKWAHALPEADSDSQHARSKTPLVLFRPPLCDGLRGSSLPVNLRG
jgi:hypothetical protein